MNQPYTPRTPYRVRKTLEIAFRRWLTGLHPSRTFASHLRVPDRELYRSVLAALFAPGMAWETYALVWQADHIVPLCRFDLSQSPQIALAWSVDNLRPLTIDANKARGASIADAYCALLSRAPIDPTEHAALVAMIEPRFRETYPAIKIVPRGELSP